MSQNHSIIIVGKGISGLILSILLKRQRIDHLLIARKEKAGPPPLGETIPPSTVGLLEAMQLRNLFEGCASRTRGYHSLWGSDQMQHTSFVQQRPFNYGLKLNKAALIQQLEAEVSDHICHADRINDWRTTHEGVEMVVQTENDQLVLNSPMVIDATGRARAVLNRFQVPIKEFDQTLAFSCLLDTSFPEDLPYGVLTETFELGWCIASKLNGQCVMTLYTDKEIVSGMDLTHFESWKDMLASTKRLHQFLQESPKHTIRGFKANSSLASQIAGDQWLAIGDAAMAFDPLSSHGISNAIFTAKIASEAIVLSQSDSAAKTQYAQRLTGIFYEYLQHRGTLYSQEQRWPTEFWQNNTGRVKH